MVGRLPPLEDIRCVHCLSSEHSQRIEAELSKWIRKVYKAEVLHSPSLRKRRVLHSDPFDLPDYEPIINGDQQVAIDSRERSRSSGIEGNGFRCLDIKDYPDVIWRYKIDRTNPQTARLLERSLAHHVVPSSLGVESRSVSVPLWVVFHRAFSSSAIR